MKHVYYDREDGLAHCMICNAAEGQLLPHCPGKRLNEDALSACYKGRVQPIEMAHAYRIGKLR